MSETSQSLHKFYETKVGDIMQTTTSEPACVEEKTDVTTIFSILNNKGYVWVVDTMKSKQILGVITENDTIALLSPPSTSLQDFEKPDPRSLQFGLTSTAEEIMSKNPVTVSPEETLKEVIIKMKQYNVKQLPVVDKKNSVVGDITLHQLIQRYTMEKP